jgi:chemotaxis protein CheD
VGGMLHALLPSAPKESSTNSVPSKFVDQGIPLLIKSIEKLGANSNRTIVKLCGGAHMLSAPGFNDVLNIGKRNIAVATESLQKEGLHIRAQDTGGNTGRTVKLRINDGLVTVKTLGQGEIRLG